MKKKLNDMLEITDKLKIRPQDKIRIVTQFIHSQLAFKIKVYDFPLTWIEQTLDALCFKFIRRWLELPVSACLSEVFVLCKSRGGFGSNSFKSLAEKMRIVKRNAIRNSSSSDLRELWSATQGDFIETDCLLVSSKDVRAAAKKLAKHQSDQALNHLQSLSVQGSILSSITGRVADKDICLWVNTIEQASGTIYNFARKALVQCLPTATNLVRWGRSQDPNCPLCKHPQTNKHVLSNCSASVALDRYKQRHDKVLLLLVSWLRSVTSSEQTVYCDLPGDPNEVTDLFHNRRPDIAIMNDSSVNTLELTICHESNLVLSKQYKTEKYENLSDFTNVICSNKSISCFTIEISSLGFISSIGNFIKLNKLPNIPTDIKSRIINSVLNSSLNIYYNRNVDH